MLHTTDVKPPMIENQELPVYRLDESNEELIVGAPSRGPRAWMRRMKARCEERRAMRAANGGCCRHSCFARLFKWIFTFAIIFFVARFFLLRAIAQHPATCVPVNETTTTITLPYASERTGILLHRSITTGDTHIVHSDSVANGTISISFELPTATDLENDEDTAGELFVCTVAKSRGVGLGLFTRRGDHTPVPAVLSATVKVAPDVEAPKVVFLGRSKSCTREALRKYFIDDAITRYDNEHLKEWTEVY